MTTVKLGEIEITAILDGHLDLDPLRFLPDIDPARLASYPNVIFGDVIRFPMTTYVVRTPSSLLLVDVGLGPHMGRTRGETGRLPAGLEAAGVKPEAVDAVLFTHLHADHVGWSCTEQNGRFQPLFPNARYLIRRTEWQRWEPETAGYLDTQLRPLFAAGQATLIDDGHEPAPGVSVLDTPGHTAGHVSVLISSGGEGAVITGDAAHTPLELEETEIGPAIDENKTQSAASRQALVERIEAEGLLVLGGHFPPPHAGRLLRVGQRRTYQPLT